MSFAVIDLIRPSPSPFFEGGAVAAAVSAAGPIGTT